MQFTAVITCFHGSLHTGQLRFPVCSGIAPWPAGDMLVNLSVAEEYMVPMQLNMMTRVLVVPWSVAIIFSITIRSQPFTFVII
jgi:hypothetical protein